MEKKIYLKPHQLKVINDWYDADITKCDNAKTHFDILDNILEYMVEYENYSYDHIGDNTDFEVKHNGKVVLTLELC